MRHCGRSAATISAVRPTVSFMSPPFLRERMPYIYVHSPMGGLLLIVLGLAIRRVVTIATGIPADPSLVMHSLVFGIGSHLLLDVLGHPENMLLYPFRKPGVNRLYIPSRTFQRAYSLALSGLMLLLWLRAR